MSSDLKELLSILSKSAYDETRASLLAKIEESTDQVILSDIAKNTEDFQIRQAAVRRITNPKILIDLAQTAEHSDVREIANLRLILL